MAPRDWMCLNVKAFGAVAEFHPYRVTWRNIAVTLTTRESARQWAAGRLCGSNPGAIQRHFHGPDTAFEEMKAH